MMTGDIFIFRKRFKQVMKFRGKHFGRFVCVCVFFLIIVFQIVKTFRGTFQHMQAADGILWLMYVSYDLCMCVCENQDQNNENVHSLNEVNEAVKLALFYLES